MLQRIIYKYLKSDAELRGLLGATVNKTKIYPNSTLQVLNAPCIIYYAATPTNPTSEPYLYSENITLEYYSEDEKQALSIQNRLYALLNQFDNFVNNSLAENGIIIRESHAVGAGVENSFPLKNKQYVNQAVSFDFLYTKSPAGQGA